MSSFLSPVPTVPDPPASASRAAWFVEPRWRATVVTGDDEVAITAGAAILAWQLLQAREDFGFVGPRIPRRGGRRGTRPGSGRQTTYVSSTFDETAIADIIVAKIGYLEPTLYDLAQGWTPALTPGPVDHDPERLGRQRIIRPMFQYDDFPADPT